MYPASDLDQCTHLSVIEAPKHLLPAYKKKANLVNIRNLGCMKRGRGKIPYRRERK